MTLEELKNLMLEAKSKSLEAPENKELQKAFAVAEKAYNDAKAAAESSTGGEDDDEESEEFDEESADDKTKKYIQKLRKEAAGHRTKAKEQASKVKAEQERVKAILKAAGIESEDDKPEDKIKNLTTETQTMAFRNAVLESAMEHGIPRDQIDFYEFLISKATDSLQDGEELPEEKLLEIVKKVKGASGGKKANSTVEGGGGSGTPPPGDKGGNKTVTLERFCAMSITEKSKLFESNRDLYTALVTEAKAKKKLV